MDHDFVEVDGRMDSPFEGRLVGDFLEILRVDEIEA